MIREVSLQPPEVCVKIDFDDPDDRGDEEVELFYLTLPEAARLLAGLEVALEDALRAAGRGRCLHCGEIHTAHAGDHEGEWMPVPLHCENCSGILEPVQDSRAGKGGVGE